MPLYHSCLRCIGLKLSLPWSLSSSNSTSTPCLCLPFVLLFLNPVSLYTWINWHWNGLQKFFVLLSPPTGLTLPTEKSCAVCSGEIGRTSNFKQFTLSLFYRHKLEREKCGLIMIMWSNHQQNDSWWQILWIRLDLLLDPYEHLQLEDVLPEHDDLGGYVNWCEQSQKGVQSAVQMFWYTLPEDSTSCKTYCVWFYWYLCHWLHSPVYFPFHCKIMTTWISCIIYLP